MTMKRKDRDSVATLRQFELLVSLWMAQVSVENKHTFGGMRPYKKRSTYDTPYYLWVLMVMDSEITKTPESNMSIGSLSAMSGTWYAT